MFPPASPLTAPVKRVVGSGGSWQGFPGRTVLCGINCPGPAPCKNGQASLENRKAVYPVHLLLSADRSWCRDRFFTESLHLVYAVFSSFRRQWNPRNMLVGNQLQEGADMKKSIISILSVFDRMIGGLRAWRRRRQAIRVLQAMPDHLLRDIGIERHEIMEGVVQYGSACPQSQPQPRSQTQPGIARIEPLLISPRIKDAA